VRFFEIGILLLLTASSLPVSVGSPNAGKSFDLATQKLVLADYLNPWSNPTFSREWGGWGWHECGTSHDPDYVYPNGTRDIASIFYPLIGPYDAGEEAVMKYHIRLAQASGLDAFVVDWDGITGFYDFPRINRNFMKMLKLAELQNFGVAIDYDAMRYYVGHTGPGVKLIPDRTKALRQVHDDLTYAIKQFGPSPAYLKFHDQPVIFVFGAGGGSMTRDEWGDIITQLSNEGLRAFYVDMQGQTRKLYPYFKGYFPWLGAGEEDLSPNSASFINDWAAVLRRSAQYMDIKWGLAVWPGFDNSPVSAWCAKNSSGSYWIQILDRKNGLLYNQTWTAVMRNKPSFIFIVTWNDWNEATIIEPARQYGYKYLYATELYASQFKGQKPDYDGIPVPLEIYDATSAIQQASKDGRTVGLDIAQQYLQNAETAFDFTHDYGSAASFARKAVDAAKASDYPKSYYEAKGLLAEAESLKTNATAANFTSTQAKTLFNEGVSAFWQAEYAYRQGDYNATITYAQAAVRFFEQAFQAERTARTFPLVQLRFHYEYLAAAAVIILIVLAAPRLRRNAKRNGELT